MTELINQRLKAAREKIGLTQAALSEKLGFKDRQTLAAIEAGQRRLSADKLLLAMQVLKLDLDYFTDPYLLVGEGQFSWHTDKAVRAGLLDEFEGRAGCWVALYRSLEELKAAEANPLQQRLTDCSDFMDAQVAAESLGRAWKLGDIPALGLEQKVREVLDALVLYVDAPWASPAQPVSTQGSFPARHDHRGSSRVVQILRTACSLRFVSKNIAARTARSGRHQHHYRGGQGRLLECAGHALQTGNGRKVL